MARKEGDDEGENAGVLAQENHWRKRVARAVEVDMRTNSKKAKKKWGKLVIEDTNKSRGWKLELRERKPN